MLHHYCAVFFILLAASNLFVTRGQECAQGVDDCVNTIFSIVTNHANNRDIICSATDKFLACVARETKSCDPVVAANVKEGVSPMIDLYRADPYKCPLESANSLTLQNDNCSQALSMCSVFFYQAETDPHYATACSLFEKYLNCMMQNTSLCGADLKTYISQHTHNATAKFDAAPYYCEEHLHYDLKAADANMAKCNNILRDMNIKIMRQDYVCSKYHEFYTCTVKALAPASPRQFQEYLDYITSVSQPFIVYPYFCNSDDPCMTLFQACNSSAYNLKTTTPCELRDIYTTCLNTIQGECAVANYAGVAKKVQTLGGEIHSKYNCIAANNNTPGGSGQLQISQAESSGPLGQSNNGKNNAGSVMSKVCLLLVATLAMVVIQ